MDKHPIHLTKIFWVILSFFLIGAPLQAKSFLCRSDGSVEEYSDGKEKTLMKPLRQYDVEEIPTEQTKNKPSPNDKFSGNENKSDLLPDQSSGNGHKSDFVPVTKEENERRSNI